MLSDIEILNELVNEDPEIMIYPFVKKNIKGNSINLTASKFAWKVSDGSSAFDGEYIVIPANDTVCIHTKESVWVSRRFGGTFHSKVSLVTEGLGHISTTLDPQWLGSCLISINNPTNSNKRIKVGRTFVTLILFRLDIAATRGKNENAASRPDLRARFELTEEEKDHFDQELFRSYEGLRATLTASEDFQNLINEKDEIIKEQNEIRKEKQEFERSKRNNLYYPLFICIVGSFITTAATIWFMQ